MPCQDGRTPARRRDVGAAARSSTGSHAPMLSLYGPDGPVTIAPGGRIPDGAVWLDLNDPTPGGGRRRRGIDRIAGPVAGGSGRGREFESPAPGEGRALPLDTDDYLRAQRLAAEAAGSDADEGASGHRPVPRPAQLHLCREADRRGRRQRHAERGLPGRAGRTRRQPRRCAGGHGDGTRHALIADLRFRCARARPAPAGKPAPAAPRSGAAPDPARDQPPRKGLGEDPREPPRTGADRPVRVRRL